MRKKFFKRSFLDISREIKLSKTGESKTGDGQGSAMGMYGGICENSGIMAGAFSGGFVWNIFGPRATFLLGSLVCMIGIIMCLFLNTQGIIQVNKFELNELE